MEQSNQQQLGFGIGSKSKRRAHRYVRQAICPCTQPKYVKKIIDAVIFVMNTQVNAEGKKI